jgi:hypothetical protein
VANTPLDVGDMFLNVEKLTTYILLGQPCDLIVRSNGERAGKRVSDRQLAPLVPLRRITNDEFNGKPVNHWKTHAAIQYYYSDSNDIAEIRFAEAEWVETSVLDLAVLNPDGLCRLDLNQLPLIPDKCTLGWKIRFESLATQFSEERCRLDRIQKHIGRIKNRETKDLIWQTSIAPRSYAKGVFNFGLQRIGRYRQPEAERLLKAYTQYLSRDANDLDFAKDF